MYFLMYMVCQANSFTGTSLLISMQLISSIAGAGIRTSSINTIVLTISIVGKTLIYICKDYNTYYVNHHYCNVRESWLQLYVHAYIVN